MTKLALLTVLTLSVLIMGRTHAGEDINIGTALLIREAQTVSVPLRAVLPLKNLIIQAEGLSRDSTVEVMVNGEVKGTIYAPGRDPSYVVTITRTTRSIEFRHRSGGSMRILGIHANLMDGGGHAHPREYQEVREMTEAVLVIMPVLSQGCSPAEFKEHLFPIKRTAGLLQVMVDAHGPLDRQTIKQMRRLQGDIDHAHDFLALLMQEDGMFDAVVSLMTVRETIDEVLGLESNNAI